MDSDQRYAEQLNSFIDLYVNRKDSNQRKSFTENKFTKQREIFVQLCVHGKKDLARSFFDKLDVTTVNRKDSNGDTFLHFLFDQDKNRNYILNGRVIIEAIRIITEDIQFNAYNVYNNQNQTALMLACRYGDPRVVRMLQPKTTDVFTNEKSVPTAFEIACANGHTMVVRFLLTQFDIENYECSIFEKALSRAVERNHPDVVRCLLNFRINDQLIDCKCIDDTFMQFSTKKTDVDALVVLADRINLNILDCLAKGKQISVFHDICINGNLDLAKHLASRLDFKFESMHHLCSLMVDAEFNDNTKGLLEWLIKIVFNSENACSVFNDENTCSNLFNVACRTGSLDTVQVLSSGKFDLWNKCYNSKQTPLHNACHSGNVRLVEWLLKTPAIDSINALDSDNRTPFDLACCQINSTKTNDYVEICKLLMRTPEFDLKKSDFISGYCMSYTSTYI